MQYLIHKIGVSNAVVATPGLDGWQLGAYVNVDALVMPLKMVDGFSNGPTIRLRQRYLCQRYGIASQT